MLRLHVPVFLLCCLLASCTAHQNAPVEVADRDTSVDDVEFIRANRRESRSMKCKTCAAEHREEMYKKLPDNRLIAASEVMLANPGSESEIADALEILARTKGDRKRFVGRAIASLGHSDATVRYNAAWLLGEIGSPKEAKALVPL